MQPQGVDRLVGREGAGPGRLRVLPGGLLGPEGEGSDTESEVGRAHPAGAAVAAAADAHPVRAAGVATLEAATIEAFGAHLESRGRAGRTVGEYKADLRLFLEWTGTCPADELDDAASAWLTSNRRRWSASTVRRRKASVRAFAKWAKIPGVLDDYKAPAPARGVAHPIPEGYNGVHEMLKHAETDEQRFFVSVCAFMALRSAEALSIRARDFDLVRRRAHVEGKGAKGRVLPIPSHCVAPVEAMVAKATDPDAPLLDVDYSTVRRWVRKLGEAAGLSVAVKPHDLRHTGGTHVWRKTQDLRTVQEMLGHADPRTTTIYTAVSIDAMAAGMEE